MKTPIFDFVKGYIEADVSRFHMPGHKGQPILGCEPYDITEISGADVLYAAEGIIEESEQNASALFGTAHSFYSTEGSSLAIKAMLALATANRPKGKRPLVLAARNVHKAFVYACALLDLDVAWLYSKAQEHLCSCTVTAKEVAQTLQALPCLPSAVYLTSPDYLGQIADVEGIAKVCHEHKIPLLVDNAHGAYLHFLTPSRHPIALGADMCCDSAHKTLPVLTGGAYLHISQNADQRYCKDARNMLSLFASTSPSYLTLQSLDLCNQYLADGYRSKLQTCIDRLGQIKQQISECGFTIENTEPLKLVCNAKKAGYQGSDLADHLRRFKIEVEFADDDYLVLMITPETSSRDLERLITAFASIPTKEPLDNTKITSIAPKAACSIREAIFAPHEQIDTEHALSRICATPTVSCPPAIPVVISGERISEAAIRTLKQYGFSQIDVISE